MATSRGQCTYVWSEANARWDKEADCGTTTGAVCAQDPNQLGITGDDGDLWITPCVVRLTGQYKPKAKSAARKKK